MLQVAKDGQYESPIKALLSGLRLLEKMSIIPAIVVPAEWMIAKSLKRLRILRNPRSIRWAEGDITCRIAKRKDLWEWKEFECLGMVVLSLTNMLRIGEAWTVSSPSDGKLCFMGEKSRGGEHEHDPGPSRRVGCGSSEKNVTSMGWPKTDYMGVSYRRTWKRYGWRSWQAQSLSTTNGTACLEAERRTCGPQEHETKSSCSWADGSRRRWRGTTQSPSMLVNLWSEESSRCQYVGRMGTASCMEAGPPNSGGQRGCEKSSANWQQRHKRMAKFWDRLDTPPEKGEGADLQDRQGKSRRQWVHGRRMGEVAELGEELDMDLIQVHDAICGQVHVRERPRVSEAVSQLLLGVCDAAGDCAAETILVVVGCLAELAEKGIDPEDEESYYSNEEDHGEVDPAVAAKGLG